MVNELIKLYLTEYFPNLSNHRILLYQKYLTPHKPQQMEPTLGNTARLYFLLTLAHAGISLPYLC